MRKRAPRRCMPTMSGNSANKVHLEHGMKLSTAQDFKRTGLEAPQLHTAGWSHHRSASSKVGVSHELLVWLGCPHTVNLICGAGSMTTDIAGLVTRRRRRDFNEGKSSPHWS